VYDREATKEELRKARAKVPRNARKTMEELGLNKSSEIEIRSFVSGAEVIITKDTIAKLLKVKEDGMYCKDTNKNTVHSKIMKKSLYNTERVIATC
jgi:hypothetical protein